MSNFSYLKKVRQNTEDTVNFEVPNIQVNGKSFIFHVVPATDENKAVQREQLKNVAKHANKSRNSIFTQKFLEEQNTRDKYVYAHHVVKGWENVVDGKGQEVSFSPDNFLELINGLDSWAFTALREFCTTPSNFIKTDNLVTEEDAVRKGKS